MNQLSLLYKKAKIFVKEKIKNENICLSQRPPGSQRRKRTNELLNPFCHYILTHLVFLCALCGLERSGREKIVLAIGYAREIESVPPTSTLRREAIKDQRQHVL
ncbi:MAG: hypothetical protein H6Q42_1463 [Deltaproteobacteria bacterium]|nr:hypothetical protein [Deltaproteobacteria bacterium]